MRISFTIRRPGAANARLSYIRRLKRFAVTLTGEAATDGSLAFGINLSFSLDPSRGFALSARPIAQAGEVEATVYRDLNNNGVRDPGEPLEPGAIVTTGTTQAQTPTDAHGTVEVTGLAPFHPVTVGVDLSSLSDPMLVPREALQVVVPETWSDGEGRNRFGPEAAMSRARSSRVGILVLKVSTLNCSIPKESL